MKGFTALWLFKILKKGSLASDIINYTVVKELKNLCRYLNVTTAGTIPETEPQNQRIQSKKDKSVIGIALSSKEKTGNWNTVWKKKKKANPRYHSAELSKAPKSIMHTRKGKQ